MRWGLPPAGQAGQGPDHGASQFEKIQRENAELRRAKLELTEHLELAIANIQRLTLDNLRGHCG